MLLEAFRGVLADAPDAVRVGADAMSWERLSGAAAAVASRIGGADVVAVHATPTLHTLVAITGCLLAGVPAVPVPPDAGPMEWAHILRDSHAALLLTGTPDALRAQRGLDAPRAQPGLAALAALPRAEARLAGGIVPVNLSAAAPLTMADQPGARPALILYTSGTTGPPKGVVLSRDAIEADLTALAAVWAWTADDVLVHGLPLYHVHGLVLGVLGALRTGCRLVHVGTPRPDRYAAEDGTLYFGVPTVWGRICADPVAARRLARARLLVSGSAGLPAAVFERLRALTGHRPIERYGMTETLITVSTRADGPRRAGEVGQPVPGAVTRLVDEHGSPVPHDGASVGELQVRGDMLFSGYLGRADVTAAAYTSDGWLRTGDAATVDADGNHRIIGRLSTDLISTGGYRVGAGEVEDALLTHPAVREAAVVGEPDDDLGQRIVAYVVADGVTAEALRTYVATVLSRHKRPRQVHLLAELPRNAMGKVQKTLLQRNAG